MKKIIGFLMITIVTSCNSLNVWEYLAIYKRPGSAPAYLIIKGGSLKQCDLVYTNIGYGVTGNYVINLDTLAFYPKYEYNSNHIFVPDSIPYIFVYDRRRDCLIHIRDDPFWGYHEEVYKRIK